MGGPKDLGAALSRRDAGRCDPKERLGGKLIRLISDNPRPRPRWRANPPMKRLRMSAVLRGYFYKMAMGAVR